MSNHSLSAQNLMATLPQVLKNDTNLAALASSIANILAKRSEEIRRVAIYSRIDELPEDMLDILAHDFKVDWWDYSYTVEQKRQILKDSFMVHKRLGTKKAVETAISAVYPDTKVLEWFEYGGEPYTFRLNIDATNISIDSASHQRVLWLVEYYKNLRSKMGDIIYNVHPAPVAGFVAVKCVGCYMRQHAGSTNNMRTLEVTIHEVE